MLSKILLQTSIIVVMSSESVFNALCDIEINNEKTDLYDFDLIFYFAVLKCSSSEVKIFWFICKKEF